MDKQKALAAIEGLTFSDCFSFFNERATDRDKQIADLGCSQRNGFALKIDNDGGTECDGAITSEGDDNGAYLLTWTWVDFAGTPLDKDEDEGGDEDEEAAA